MKTNLIEVEFDSPTNANILFQPLQRTMRGRFDVRRMKNAGRLFQHWPEAIPGERLHLDISTGEAAIIEPLHESQYAAIRERIASKGMKIGAERQSFQADVPTWLHWLKGLIASGKAKLLQGSLPEKIEGKPQLRFHSTERPDPNEAAIERLTDAVSQQTQLLGRLVEMLCDKKS